MLDPETGAQTRFIFATFDFLGTENGRQLSTVKMIKSVTASSEEPLTNAITVVPALALPDELAETSTLATHLYSITLRPMSGLTWGDVDAPEWVECSILKD